MNLKHSDGLVFNIQRFSTKDGPGIRTTVFLKGCNLNCLWCHNPESIDPHRLLRFIAARCSSCGRCSRVCSCGAVRMVGGARLYMPEKCSLCGDCVTECPEDALEITGGYYEAEALHALLMKDRDFYGESGGGITFSGGEPLLQTGFISQMLKRLKASGVHTALDTALNVSRSRIEAVLPRTDLWLVDLKGMDSESHRRNTGAGNELILSNLEWLAKQDAELIIRMPLVRGLNDSETEIKAAAGFMKKLPGLLGVELLPYHNLGVEKTGEYGALELQDEYEPPGERELVRVREIMESAGIRLL